MAYRLLGDEPIVDGLVRIALEQIDRSLEEVAEVKLARLEAVHQVRKRCKKIRGLLRLARTALPDVYRAEDDWFRDASRGLASVRQADATVLALESLRDEGSHPLADEVINRVRAALAGHQRAWNEEPGIEARLAEFNSAMQQARQRVQQWAKQTAGAHKIASAIMTGFENGYRRGRDALRTAQRVQADEYLHEFRKWAKYHWHHTKLLERLAPKQLRRRGQRLVELSNWLGDDRDLGALRMALLELVQTPARPGAQQPQPAVIDDVKEVVAAIDRRRGRLRKRAFRLAKRLYQEKPKVYAQRLEKRCKFAS